MIRTLSKIIASAPINQRNLPGFPEVDLNFVHEMLQTTFLEMQKRGTSEHDGYSAILHLMAAVSVVRHLSPLGHKAASPLDPVDLVNWQMQAIHEAVACYLNRNALNDA